MKLKEEGEEERGLEDGRKMVGGWAVRRGSRRGVPSGAVVGGCMVCLARCEREGYVRLQSPSTITTLKKFSMLESRSGFLSRTPTDKLLHNAPPFGPLALDEDVYEGNFKMVSSWFLRVRMDDGKDNRGANVRPLPCEQKLKNVTSESRNIRR